MIDLEPVEAVAITRIIDRWCAWTFWRLYGPQINFEGYRFGMGIPA